jgi:hypothetical protein
MPTATPDTAKKGRRTAAPNADHKLTANTNHDAASDRWEKYSVTAPALGFDPTLDPHKTVQVASELLDWLVVTPLALPLPLWLWGLWYMGELALDVVLAQRVDARTSGRCGGRSARQVVDVAVLVLGWATLVGADCAVGPANGAIVFSHCKP